MAKVIIAKKATTEISRHCLNCGKDITNKRKGTKFCCKSCYNAYNDVDRRRDEFRMSV